TKFGGQPPAGDFLSPGGVFTTARFVGLIEVVLRTEITRLNEIHDAPEIEQPVFERRASQREALIRAKLLDRESHLGRWILDELRFVEDDGAEFKLLERLQVAAQQRVVGDDQIMLRN